MTDSASATLDALARLSVEQLSRVQASLADVPRNDSAWTYTIRGFDGTPYITRTLLPRVGGWRPLIHRIHRADLDPHPHNHPWRVGRFRVVGGGYVDERWRRCVADGLVTRVIERRTLRVGDHNDLLADDFHRAVDVLPGTMTVGVVGERVQDWGFLVDDAVVPHADYFAARGYVGEGGLT